MVRLQLDNFKTITHTYNTDGIINKLVMVFANHFLLLIK
jgi:hypothetical protein